MRRRSRIVCSLSLLLPLLILPPGCEPEGEPARLAVTNSYLESAAREFLGAETPMLRLAGPGMCPGHFDMRPSQARALADCEVLLRFDFQASLENKLSRAEALRVVPVTVDAGLASPAGYGQACAQIAAELDLSSARLAEVQSRLAALEAQAGARLDEAGVRGATVVCSVHQAAACRQLGLGVVAEFAAADRTTPQQIDAVLRTGRARGVRCVIANRPEGVELADAIAARLGVPVVVFHNFPDTVGDESGFDRMYLANLDRLIAAIGS
jgi:zinc/manganese transport system substrate-binding protein